MSVLKKALRAGLMTGAAAWLAASAAFANDAKYNLDLPAQDLSQSLLDLSARTGVPVVADGALVEGARAPALRGRMTPAEALEKLLAPSGLSYERDRATVYRIVEPQPVIEIPDTDYARAPRDEIIVTGTNIRTASHIRGAPTDSAPLFEFDQSDVARSGYRSAEEFIQVQPSSFGGPRSNPFEFTIVPVFNNPGDPAPAGFRQLLREPFLQQNGVSIHGLSALTLVNGRRFLGDLATLPVTAIERIDVLADGASAIYGDGAVPGVVNAVLLDEFDGVRTTARYGFVSDSGAEENLAAVTAGTTWDDGKIHGTYEFLERTNLTLADRSYQFFESELFGPTASTSEPPSPADALPGERRHRAYVAAEQAITDGLMLYAEGSASVDKVIAQSTFLFITPPPEILDSIRTAQYATTVGAQIDLGGEWRSDLSLHRSVLKTISRPGRGSLWTVRAKADGPFFDAPGGVAKLAIGGEYRAETPFVADRSTSDQREIFSAFGETFIPLISNTNGRPGVERLELSLAGRFDHYENSGGVLSPRVSLLWSPVAGLNLRGSYSRSHEQPLFQDFGDGGAAISFVGSSQRCEFLPPPCIDPEFRSVVFVIPEQVDLPAARSDNITLGADYSPPYLPGLSLSATYYDIDFTGRPIDPPNALDPNLEDLFPETNLRTITQEFANDIATIVRNDAIRFELPFDDCVRAFLILRDLVDITIHGDDFATRCVRLSDVVSSGDFGALLRGAQGTGRTKTRGLDLSAAYNVSTVAGDFNFFANANVVLEFVRQLNSLTPAIDVADTFSNPLDYRLRGGVSWSLNGFNAAAIVNHADSYSYIREPGFLRLIVESDELVIPVDSLTSLDLYVAYNTGDNPAAGLLRNLEFSVSAINVTNEIPQALPGARLGFDDFNADPTGRFVAFQVTKKW